MVPARARTDLAPGAVAGRVTSGKGTPEEIRTLTQALIDQGAVGAFVTGS
ncbi:MAG: hypothetical protein HYZ29_05540 [Myxococcales bacterium]|nr:hypothetical protein [Myxococcales bacterium]